MPLRSDINAINNSNLSDEDKIGLIYNLKVDALVAKFVAFVGQTWAIGSVTYRLNGVRKTISNGVTVLEFDISRTQTGFRFDPFDTLRVVNPPVGESSNKLIDEMTVAEQVQFAKDLLDGLPPGEPV